MYLFVKLPKCTECRRDHVLITSISVDDAANYAKGNDFRYCAGPERFWEIASGTIRR